MTLRAPVRVARGSSLRRGMNMRTELVPILAVAALAGCGGSPPVAKHPAAALGSANNGPSMYFPRTETVAIRRDGPHPQRLRVPANTTIRWVNRGSRTHGLRWSSGRAPHFTSGALKPEETFSIRMPRVGTVTYRTTTPGGQSSRGVIQVG
jgi:plastocyanin